MICLFGGTFDPVHVGHIHAAATVCAALGLAEIRMVLSARPSHKRATGASLDHRWEMLKLACEDHPELTPDDREMHRPRPSYTVETLEEILAEQPTESIAWVIGSDAFALLPSWHRWREVLELASLVVLSRPGHALQLSEEMAELTAAHRLDSLENVAAGGIVLLEEDMVEVAAEDIRAGLAEGRDMSHLLPERVGAYIRQHGLYGG